MGGGLSGVNLVEFEPGAELCDDSWMGYIGEDCMTVLEFDDGLIESSKSGVLLLVHAKHNRAEMLISNRLVRAPLRDPRRSRSTKSLKNLVCR